MKKYKNQITFCTIFIITMCIFYQFITMHYATDTYNIINRGYKDYAITYSLNDGRPIMCLVSLLAEYMNLPIETYIIGLTIIAIFISCISVLKLKSIFMKYIEKTKNEWIILVIAYVIIFNFTYLENMQFAECAVMAVSVLLNVIVADIIVERQKSYITKSLLLSIISIMMYQGMINWLITITFVISILKEKKINKVVIENVLLSGSYVLLGIILNLIQIKITGNIFNLTQNRIGNIKNIVDNIKYIFKNLYPILEETYQLFPSYMLLIYLAILLIYTNVFLKDKNEKINILGIIVVTIGASFAPYLITLSSFGAARMSFSIGAMLGLIILYIYNVQKETEYKKIIIVILAFYMLLTYLNYINIMTQHKIANKQSQEESQIIGNWIVEYEQESGNEIKKIIFLKDKKCTRYNNNVKNKSALCYRALYAEWSRIGVINYYNNRKFIEVKTDGKYNKYFKNQNWDRLEKEQLIFEDDILYYCRY